MIAGLMELQRGGEWWRVVTCHFTHFTPEQLLWDGVVFAALAVVCGRRDWRAFLLTLLAAIVVIPLAVLLFTDLQAYRGLSGLDSALFALLLVQARSRLAAAFAVGFGAKMLFELATASTVFVSSLGEGVVPVPAAHLTGAVVGALVAFARNRTDGTNRTDGSAPAPIRPIGPIRPRAATLPSCASSPQSCLH